MQTKDNHDLSRIRQRLVETHELVGRQLKVLMSPQPIMKGSVYELKRKCGKAGCRCTKGHLHSSTVITWSEQGRTKMRTAQAEDSDELRLLTKRYKRFRESRSRVVKLQKEMIGLIDNLESGRRKR